NDLKADDLEFTHESPTQILAIPKELLKDQSPQRVRFEMTGRGRFTYQCVLSGVVPNDKVQSSTKRWVVSRRRTPAPRELDGQTSPVGFDVVTGSYAHFHNKLSPLPVGRRGQVGLQVRRHNVSSSTPPEELDYLVVVEPIPAGASVVE